MFDLAQVQAAIRDFGLDGWLLCDFRGSNPLARRILKPGGHGSRRFFYWIPADGEPRKLVHRIEPKALDHLPGPKEVYLRWQELERGVAGLVAGAGRVAMEYSPRNANPYIAKVDAGTVELVKSTGCEVVGSGDLIQLFEATWDDAQWAMHLEADRVNLAAFDRAWSFIAERARAGRPATEAEVMRLILDHFRESGTVTYSPPIVGVGPHGGDPHYETTDASDTPIAPGDLVLLDLWSKVDDPKAPYSDLTKMGYVGESVPDEYAKVFKVVADARDAAIGLVREAFGAGRPLRGWEVDDAARAVIDAAGYGDAFIHRTGHSMGLETTHGNGANMDNLETREERLVLPRTAFSIEPGIYLPEFGVRSEVDVFVDAAGAVHVTGDPQRAILALLA